MKLTPTFLYFSLFVSIFCFPFVKAQSFELVNTKFESSGFECMVNSPDKKAVLSGHDDGTIAIWELGKFQATQHISVLKSTVNCITFNKTGNKFAVCGIDNSIKVYSYPGLELLTTISVPIIIVNFVVFTPDDQYLFFGGQNEMKKNAFGNGRPKLPYGALFKVTLNGGGVEEVIKDVKQSDFYYSITDGNIDVTGNYIAFSKGKEIILYNWKDNLQSGTIKFPVMLNNIYPVENGYYVWGDKMLMKVEKNNAFFEITHKITAGTRSAGEGYSPMRLSENKRFLITGDDGNNVNIWDSIKLDNIQQLRKHEKPARSFAFVNNDTILLTGGKDGMLCIWKYSSKPVAKENIHKDSLSNITDVSTQVGLYSIQVKTQTAKLEIWDPSISDKQRIRLKLNNKVILDNHTLTNRRWEIYLQLDSISTGNILEMELVSTDDASIVKAQFHINAGGKDQYFFMQSTSVESSKIRIIVQ